LFFKGFVQIDIKTSKEGYCWF